MIENKLLLTTPTDPRNINKFFNEKTDVITSMTIISIDYPPLEIKYESQNSKNEFIFGKKTDQASMYDVAGIIIETIPVNEFNNISNLNHTKSSNEKNRKIFILGNEVVYISNANKKLVSINGSFDVIPEQLISKIYTNFEELKSAHLEELDEILADAKDEVAIKAFKKLGKYFTASNYEINNNIFNLIEHQEQATAISKRVLLKKMVTWEIK